MICTICGNEYHSASLGGPGICSFCDCYPANESKLRQENAKLRTELELLRGRPAVSGEPSEDVIAEALWREDRATALAASRDQFATKLYWGDQFSISGHRESYKMWAAKLLRALAARSVSDAASAVAPEGKA